MIHRPVKFDDLLDPLSRCQLWRGSD